MKAAEQDGAPPRSRPVIGLTTYLDRIQQGVWDARAAFLHASYIDPVGAAGGTVVLLPPLTRPGDAAAVLDRIDGLILTGGYDIDPAIYGRPRHPESDPADESRDSWETALLREVERLRLPLLAICRGFQLLNVVRGGTLHQHLPETLGTDRYRAGGGRFAENPVDVPEGSRLSTAVGSGRRVIHSHHHQGVERVGDGLIVTARSDDDLVQAVEDPREDRYAVGVQWHPEQDAADRGLFEDLVRQAERHRDGRAG
ncbi:putative glutamine amidotransferase [Microbacterium resistens]|uniref:Glutamine amidotransferase n=1 Tax=Microbacterium resistens TaxID=156977 RepID=A0ABU1SFM2_9MICO|nr:gamma-glutamyl-gamma-aminobutyrate hydrolase family protein [Microbacterium resistens]MDR6868367.1 putative glutamine amidotransferase [Microbacterium resistens]